VNGDRSGRFDDSEQFLAMAVHELRAPAGVMLGAAETLAQLCQGEELPPHVHDLVAMMTRSGRHMRRLIADLLTSAYLERGGLTVNASRVCLRPILGWAVDGTSAANGDVSIDCDPLLDFMVDAGRLEQIVTNLVANALEHGVAPVLVTATVTGAGVSIVVRDYGDGVDRRDVAHLFERFSSLAARRSASTGLGLSIARSLARAMGGDIVYLPADPGSRFVLTLVERDDDQTAAHAEAGVGQL
jgi:signal transduction histidine kinase